MKKNIGLIFVFLLPLAMSIFLFINYVTIPDSQDRISSETGYYLLLSMVVIASILFSIFQDKPYSKRSIIISALVISLILVVSLGLDMVLHMLARGIANPTNNTSGLSTGGPINGSLLKATLQIYGIRFISVLITGNLLFLVITWRRQKQTK